MTQIYNMHQLKAISIEYKPLILKHKEYAKRIYNVPGANIGYILQAQTKHMIGVRYVDEDYQGDVIHRFILHILVK